jgi:hypothetical protein
MTSPLFAYTLSEGTELGATGKMWADQRIMNGYDVIDLKVTVQEGTRI